MTVITKSPEQTELLGKKLAELLRPGDVIQLSDEAGQFYHTLLVTGFEGGTPLVAAHSNDALDRPLSSYDYAGARYLHLLGVRFLVPDGDCFEDLLEGKVLPPG